MHTVTLPQVERHLFAAADSLRGTMRIRSEEAFRDTLKHGLMNDLLTGQVRVPVAEEAAV
ncbi:MAG TPA: hypothetical protein VKQ30_02845 [Ktedonobacterales bacterium]|nr:hypothetical protein [Ktedonobacterales bacterium]